MLPHEEEQLNRRSLWLRLRWQLWWIPAMTAAGALVAALLYMGIWLGVSGERQYRQNSKYYLTFGNDAAGNPQDYYNDYTWNDLLFSIPAISQVIETELPDGMTLAQAREDIEAQILSDVRVLTIQVTNEDPETVQSLTNAVEDALVRYGSNAEEFQKIEYLSSDEVQQVVVTDRSQSALILGGLLGFLLSICGIWLRELLDDGIYCPEEAVRRYHLPVLLTICRSLNSQKEKEKDALPAFLTAENQAEADFLRQEQKDLQLVCEDESLAKETAEKLQREYGITCSCVSAEKALAGRGDSEQAAAGSRDNKRLLTVVIPFGCRVGTRTEHLLEQLQARETTPAGLVLAEADGRFLQAYYDNTRGKRSKAPMRTCSHE